MRFIIAFVLAFVLSLPAEAYTPYPVSSYSAKQTANVAQIGGLSTTHPTATQGTPNWITLITRTSAGNYEFTLAALAFATTPVCVATTGGGNFFLGSIGCSSTTACTAETRTIPAGTDADPSSLQIICMGGR